MKKVFVCLIGLLMAACGSPQKTLTISTVPEGAMLVEHQSEKQFRAPVTISYVLDERHLDANGCFQVKPFSAVWASGASVDPLPGPLLLCQGHGAWAMQFHRPQGIPGIELDIKIAEARNRQLHREKVEREIRQMRGDAALAEGIGSLIEGATCAIGKNCGYESTRLSETPSPGTPSFGGGASEEIPAWAKQKDALDQGIACGIDGWGRAYCGVKER